MAEITYPHQELLDEAKDAFSTKDLPSELQSEIKVFNMHKGRHDEKENQITSLKIAQAIEQWMTDNDYVIEEEEDEPAPAATATPAPPAPAVKTEAEIAAEKQAATDKAIADGIAKALAEKEAAAQAAADKAAAEKEVADKLAAEKAAAEAAEKAKIKKVPLIGGFKFS